MTLFQLLVLSSLFYFQFQNSVAVETSIVFATLGRSRYAFDIFSLPTPPLSTSTSESEQLELQISDGRSVNYNGFFPTNTSHLLSLFPSSPPPLSTDHQLESLVYVSERSGSPNLHLDILSTATRLRRVALENNERVQVPLLPTHVSMKDRPSISGDYIVYVSTHEDSKVPRKSWAAVYSTHIPTGSTKRLTPPGISDFSPAVSPSGEWTAVASSGEEGWTGEVEELSTGVFVYRTGDGSERVKVVDHGGWPSWSDDSTLYFHRRSEDGWWSVYRARIGRERDLLVVERVTPPGFHAFTPAAGDGFVAMATRRPTSDFRHIEVLDLDGNLFVEMTRPVAPNFHHYNPFVSPDSGRIGYHRCRGSGGSSGDDGSGGTLILENIKSPSPETRLLRIDGSYPTFSPDGKRIAYVGFPGLYVVNSDGSGKREILSGTTFTTAWDWKRKGVIYTSYGPTFAKESTEVDIISITLNEELELGVYASPSIKRLTTTGTQINNAFPSPSPDGKWVVFRSGRSGHKNLYIMDALEGESASLRQLTDGPWTDTMCNWSPDGEWIAFSSDRDNPGGGSFAVYFIHPSGTGLRKVIQSGEGGRANHPFFSPDSKSIVFTTDYAAVSAEPIANPHHYQPYGDIFTARVDDGSNIQRLTHNSYEDGTPAWGPTFTRPVDVFGGEPLCKFDDCQWLAPQVSNYYYSSSLGCCRRA